MRLHSVIGGANALDELHLEADQALVLAADIVRAGVATAHELSMNSLPEQIKEELAANQGVIIGRAEIGAWSCLAASAGASSVRSPDAAMALVPSEPSSARALARVLMPEKTQNLQRLRLLQRVDRVVANPHEFERRLRIKT